MASSELSVMLTAKGNLETELKSARDRVKDLSKEIRNIQASGGTVGEDLASEFRQATQAAERLGREVNETNRKIKTAASQSSTAAAKLGRAWTKTASIFENNVVAGISAVGIALAGRAALNAYAEAEKYQSQLNLAYVKFGKIADVSRESFNDLNTAIMNSTGADDDALAGAEAILARFNLTGSAIQRLIPLVNDYSIATGTDLTSSAETIGKALMGNARALKALGIDFKATGNASKDLALLMVELEKKVGGAGEAFGQTTAGQIAIAQQNFSNLQEEIGLALVPALEAVVDIVKPMSEAFSGLSDPVKKAAVAITAVATAALIATPRLIALKANMAMAGMSAGALAGKLRGVGSVLMGPWGVALAIGTAALLDYQSQQSEARERTDSLTEAMRRQATEGMRPTAEALVNMFNSWSSGHGTFIQQTEALGLSLDEFVSAVMNGGPELDALNSKLYDLERVGGSTTGMARGLGIILRDVVDNFGDAKVQSTAVEKALTALGYSSDSAGEDLSDLGDEADSAAKKISALERALNGMNQAARRVSALRSWKKAVNDFIKKPSEDAALSAYDSFNAATATFKDGSAAQARFVKSNYDEMAATIRKSGLPKRTQEQLITPLTRARVEAERVLTELDLINGKSVNANVNLTTTGNAPFNPIRRAAGGIVMGPGTATSDSIPALLSNGEYVLRASAVRALGVSTLNKLNHADKMTDPALLDRMAVGGVPVVASGGPMIGSIVVNNPSRDVDVERAVLRGMARAERIKKERG